MEILTYREVTPEWVAKTYNKYLAALSKDISFKTRENIAFAATKHRIFEEKHTKPLDEFFKPTLEDFIKILNYQDPVFQRSGNK